MGLLRGLAPPMPDAAPHFDLAAIVTMLEPWRREFPMRWVCGLMLSAWLAISFATLVGGEASAGIVCGNFDGKFTCRNEYSAGKQFGKNATPGAPADAPASDAPPADQQGLPPQPGGGWSTD